MTSRTGLFCAAAIGAALFALSPAYALTAQERMKACGEEWKTAKDAGKVPAGETWQTFFKSCNVRLQEAATPAAAKPAAAAPAAATPAAAAPAAAAPAAAAAGGTPQERMKACGEAWKTMKETGKVPAGETWQKFYGECNTRLQAGGTAAPVAAAAKPAATPAAATVGGTPQERMKACGEAWKTMKDTGKVPAGETWQKFYGECNTRLQAGGTAAPAAAAIVAPVAVPATAAKPAAAPAAAAPATTARPTATPVSTPAKPDDEDTGEGVREPTPAQLAARARMKDCGAEWRAQKEAGKIPEGQTWPQYWSACNTRLKAAGK